MHGSEGFDRERHVRWSIDLRYGPKSQPFDWHGNPDWVEEWPPFTARVGGNAEITSWEEWQAKWQTPRHKSAARL
jgi:hypothetical protein